MRRIQKSASALSLALIAACAAQTSEDAQSTASDLASGVGNVGVGGRLPVGPTLSDRAYYFESLGSRCFDFGGQAFWAVGAPVMIYDCNRTVAQQVRVKEIDGSHDVELRVQSLYCIGVRGGHVALGLPLELQTCNGSAAQRFALDGDSVLMGYQASGNVSRELVIEPANDASLNRTPLVVSTRETSDAEYFRLQTVDSSNLPPTTGFFNVSTESDLLAKLASGWGSVIEINDAAPLTITSQISIPAGVTLRSYRKHRYGGAVVQFTGADDSALWINADNVRITGLRFLGNPAVHGGALIVKSDAHQRVLVDHNEITGWTGSAVDVRGGDEACGTDPQPCNKDASPEAVCFPPAAFVGSLAYPRPTDVRVLRNFIHENTLYGIVTGSGAMILAQGNVEYLDQHQLSSDPLRLSGYVAYDNFLLSPTVTSYMTSNQDFDAHGSLHPGNWYDGIAGDYFDIGWNTFLQDEHYDFNLRGTPCRFASFHDNVTAWDMPHALLSRATTPILRATQNTYSAGYADTLTADLGVGDFDGDHIDDVFLGTGATWWFSSGGVSEWRLLNRMPEHASQVRFGDFDADGRTDVLAVHNGSIDVSWSGSSPWQTINSFAWALSDLAVGDFDGDHASDLFLATGSQWFYAPGGRNWAVFATSSYRTSALRFGDFTGDGKTDVFGVVANQWMIVPGGGNTWVPLRSALTSSTAGLVVADFDGDGVADVARSTSFYWQYAARGWGGFVNLRLEDTLDIATLPIGRFDADAKTDVLEWSGHGFAVSSAATGVPTIVSLQSMK